ncbi:MAG: S8 family serine peptidase [Dehalococcoidia bacterium]
MRAFGTCLRLSLLATAAVALTVFHESAPVSSTAAQSLRGPAPVSIDDVDPASVVAHRVSVTFAPGTSAADAGERIASTGAAVGRSSPEIESYEATLPAGWSVRAGITALSRLPGVVAAEPELKFQPAFQPNDPLYGGYQASYLSQMHAPEAWDMQQGDPKVVVAVIDTGVDITHPDLAGQIWTNPNPGHGGCGNDVHGCFFPDAADGGCVLSTTEPNPDISPTFYHGTFVSGIIAAGLNNSIGVAGIAPHVRIMPIKVFSCADGGTTDTSVAEGVLYAAHNGARVINLSLGGQSQCRALPLGLYGALTEALRLGVVVVSAAGNDNQACVAAPANTPGVIAVSATGPTGDQRAPFSNYGPEVTVTAIGVAVASTTSGPVPSGTNSSQHNLQTPYEQYRIDDGTSFSSPMVAGLAALLISQNQNLTPDMVRSIIQRGATPLPDGDSPGWAGAGRIDLLASLKLVPASYAGHVTLAQTVADGTPVEARIGNQVCGKTVTSTVQGRSAYAMFVSAATDVAGCGVQGAPVTFTVGGAPAATVPWKPAAVQLDLGQVAAAAPSNSSGAVLYHRGWNIVAGPAGSVFSPASGSLYTFQPGDTSYTPSDVSSGVRAGIGYWAYFTADATVPLAADGPQTYSVTVPAGQPVMIGNPSGSRELTISGADSVFAFDPVSNAYKPTRVLEPGQGAWVTSAAGGAVTLQ